MKELQRILQNDNTPHTLTILRQITENIESKIRSRRSKDLFDKYDAISLLTKNWKPLPESVSEIVVKDIQWRMEGMYFDYDRKHLAQSDLHSFGNEIVINLVVTSHDVYGPEWKHYLLEFREYRTDSGDREYMIDSHINYIGKPDDVSNKKLIRYKWSYSRNAYHHVCGDKSLNDIIASIPKIDILRNRVYEYAKYPIKRTLREINTLTLCRKRGSPLLCMLCKDVFMLILRELWESRTRLTERL